MSVDVVRFTDDCEDLVYLGGNEMDWQTFVMWMQSEGIGAVVGVLLSYVVEWFPKYETLEPKVKRLIFGLTCLLVPAVGVALGIASGFQEPVWATTFWPAIVAAGIAFGSGTLAHTRKL